MATNIDDNLELSNKQKNACLDNLVNNDDVFPQNSKKKDLNLEKYIKYEIVKKALKLAKAPNYIVYCYKYFRPDIKAISFVKYFDKENIGDTEYNRKHLCYCRNVWLCPACRSYVFYFRRHEISSAFNSWTKQDYKCYMLTLTARHTVDTRGIVLVPQIKRAYSLFRKSRVFSNIFKDNSPTGGQSIIGNFEFTFGKGGIHPHRHLLLFVKNDIISYKDKILAEWVRACAKAGIESNTKALDFREVKSSAEYLSKIGWELTDSSFAKESKASRKRLNYIELCEASLTDEWARYQLIDYIQSCKGLQALHWSKGLKKYFNIQELSDSEVVENQNKIILGWVSKKSFQNLSTEEVEAFLMIIRKFGMYSEEVRAACYHAGITLYESNHEVLYNFGNDNADDLLEIKIQSRLDFKDGDLKYNDLSDSQRKGLLL